MEIEELITILLTTVLVGITGYYATVTHKMLKIMQQQMSRCQRMRALGALPLHPAALDGILAGCSSTEMMNFR